MSVSDFQIKHLLWLCHMRFSSYPKYLSSPDDIRDLQSCLLELQDLRKQAAESATTKIYAKSYEFDTTEPWRPMDPAVRDKLLKQFFGRPDHE